MAVKKRPKPKPRPTYQQLVSGSYLPTKVRAFNAAQGTTGAAATGASSGGVGAPTPTKLSPDQVTVLLQACLGGDQKACQALTGAGYNVTGQGGLVGDIAGIPGKVASGVFGEIVPYLKVAAGGLIVIVSGLALVYVAGRNQAPKIAGAVAGPAKLGVAAASKVAPERQEARREARRLAASERTARARSRATVSSRGRSKVLSRREGAEARHAEAEYEASKGQRRREALGAFKMERERRLRSVG
jgi:hypothetical protein